MFVSSHNRAAESEESKDCKPLQKHKTPSVCRRACVCVCVCVCKLSSVLTHYQQSPVTAKLVLSLMKRRAMSDKESHDNKDGK